MKKERRSGCAQYITDSEEEKMAKAAAKKPTVTVATSKEEKLKALNTAMGNIERN